MGIFTKKSRIAAPVEPVFQWHSRPGALERLSPPWDPIHVVENPGGIKKGAKAVLKMKAGPVPYTWAAEHTAYEENRLFRDEQIKGPFSKWIHTHRFEPDGESACFLEDKIEYKLPIASIGDALLDPFIQRTLDRIFTYRHRITAEDISLHLSRKSQTPLNILVSGASGLIGSALIPFLTTGGHRIVRLVRRLPLADTNEVFWDPDSGVLNPHDLGKIDVVIHLSGENIGQGRWTEDKKKRIVESRVKSTDLISKVITALNPVPRVFVCASAIGFYGDRGHLLLDESDGPGNDFISSVCAKWEKSAEPAVQKGIRTAFMRIGVVLSPLGGALSRLLWPFKIGLGAKIASGKQYMGWVSIEDVIGAVYHTMINDAVKGPVNVVSPMCSTNIEFTKTLGRVLSRPTVLSIPSVAIKILFGEMGREILLSSTRVKPETLLNTGYRFRSPHLEEALLQMLGKG